ncbi:DUF1614 domain-containing protein [Thermococcus thioreducens]|uniref:Uncharacterized membrane protein n=1 Tax=Thermococcus thioreducens TaxID=277988 RepID=A0A0Q2M641_9EURY|nr:DUF1614 domain-containing protein [Thermococcus thioreducens]ASJ13213.1 hypothetical protein A3L14_10105 [Thermococcus thioreducens]KQH83370.1 hypothetical protein AMR53_01505 [Thermococcus thioreducens]SEW21037.1 Uncharacterized membrane protein [Thermococcus thioreducens]
MNKRRFIVPPVSLPFLLVIFLIFLAVFVIFSSIVMAAFEKLGIPPEVAYALFIFALLGSFINIPIAEEVSYEPIISLKEVRFFGISYPVPYFDWAERRVIIAINVGGALVPLSIVLYEVFRLLYLGQFALLFNTALATVIAALFSHAFARPVRGLGIAMPMFLPPLIAMTLGWLLGDGNPNLVAYVSGTMGVLIGADVMNWGKIKNLGAPMVSIGGAGTFDGIFLAGVIAVLLV